MKQNVLKDIIEFTLGKNSTRIKEQENNIYTPEDFEKDLQCINTVENVPECIISLIKSKAAPISEQTKEKFISSNFLRCRFDSKILDPWYFCYQFNEGKDFEQQINMYHQGSSLSVKKLTVGIICDLKINLPDIKDQKRIGELYKQSIIQNYILLKQTENIKKFTIATIRKIEEELS